VIEYKARKYISNNGCSNSSIGSCGWVFLLKKKKERKAKMGETFAMSGVIDWLQATSLRKMSAKNRAKATKESIQEKIKGFKKTSKETLGGSRG